MATLDERGELENMPFMPEMLKFCGKRLTVHKVGHKLCDAINKSGMRKMENAVHLTGARCDGASHGGCEAACLIYWCLIYWKEAGSRRGNRTLKFTRPCAYHLPLMEKWGLSAVVLRFLAALMVVGMLTAFAIDILASVGSTKATTWLNAGWAVALLPALWIGTNLDGIRGAAIAHSIVAVVVGLSLSILALRVAGVRILPTLSTLVRPVIGAIVAAAVIMLIQAVVGGSSFVQLMLADGAGVLAFVQLVVPRNQVQVRQMRMRVTRVR